MKGKTVVVTGGTSGIGEVAAEKLAEMGARIVLVARDISRGAGTLARLREKAPGLAHTVHYADLTCISEMKRVAAEIAEAEPRIDVLVNNAGAMFSTRKLTTDGLEYTFALNHIAYFIVTGGLRERLVASAPARIVSTASSAHQSASLDFDDLQLAKNFGPMKAYSRSKLCNILFTRELARRAPELHANCFVATRFADESGGLISRFAGLAKLLAISPEKGADTIIYLASSPKIAATTGRYFYKRRPIVPSQAAQDDRTALSLWERSAALAGLNAQGLHL